MEDKILKNNSENISVNGNNFVPLQKENNKEDAYDTDDYRRAETVASTDHTSRRTERLGVHAYETQGKPTLGSRWDTLVYEEGLQSEQANRQLGGSRLAICNESDRLIAVAKEVGDYIPSTIWDTYGNKNTKPSGESVVFLDEKKQSCY